MPNNTSKPAASPGVPRADAERAGIIIMELLERLPYGRIEILVDNCKIRGIENSQRYRMEELEAIFAPPEN